MIANRLQQTVVGDAKRVHILATALDPLPEYATWPISLSGNIAVDHCSNPYQQESKNGSVCVSGD